MGLDEKFKWGIIFRQPHTSQKKAEKSEDCQNLTFSKQVNNTQEF